MVSKFNMLVDFLSVLMSIRHPVLMSKNKQNTHMLLFSLSPNVKCLIEMPLLPIKKKLCTHIHSWLSEVL